VDGADAAVDGGGGPGPVPRLEIPVGRARLSAVRHGAGGHPQAVFLHSGISDHRSWEGLLALLAPDMEVAAYDRRGFGTTAFRAERHDQVADLLTVLDTLAMGRPVVVGNSRGGQIALDFVLAHPDRAAALVLVAPAVSGAPPVDEAAIDPTEAAIWETLAAAEQAGALDALNLGEIRLWLDGPYAPEGRVGDPLRRLALEMNRIALHAESPGHEPEPPGAWSRLAEIRCPTLVVAGDLDLAHIRARSRQVASRIAGAQFTEMAGAAHLPAFEQPAAFAVLLREFLAGAAG
jgi:pimeloyl-ACP methyl ester carboxylesterase